MKKLLSKKEAFCYLYLYRREAMKQVIQTLIKEFQDWDIPEAVAREVHFEIFPPNIRKVQVLMGVRRSGKTWIFHQKMHDLLKSGIDKRKILYINFEDDRLGGFAAHDFQSILDAYFDLNPDLTKASDLSFFFDEIHLVEGWEKFLRRLLDQEKMQLYVTGSSANMLSSEIATTLRGRGWDQEVFPCNLREFAYFKGWDTSKSITPKRASELRKIANDYLFWGGFPESLFLAKELHSALLQDYMNAVVFRDVVDRHRLSNAHQVKFFFTQILRQLAAPLSVNKLFNRIKSLGVAIGKNSLYEYLSYFEEAYALFTVPIYHFSQQVQQVNPKKIYAVDPGIITAYSTKPEFDHAARLENAVFCALRRVCKQIFYYHTQTKQEVDFITLSETGELALYQVSLDLSQQETKAREVQALRAAMEELEQKTSFLITLDHEETIQLEEYTIYSIPFWKWAMTYFGK